MTRAGSAGTETRAPDGTAIQVRNYSLWYRARRALEAVTLDVEPNSVTAIIGPSGCGKSSFLRSMNRMNDLIDGTRTEGEIRIDGADILAPSVDVVELRRKVGMVFQKANPFPKSIYENVAFGPRMAGVGSRAALDAVVERSLSLAALWGEVKDRLSASALSLSGGQQQRLCIARCLAVEPEIILMDEPASALDPSATARIEELLFALKTSYTLVVVTHNMQQAARVSDRTAFLLNGRLIETGETKQIFTSPGNRLTEDYITGRFG